MGKHSEWRKLAKKARRQRIRRTAAKERDDKEYEEQKQIEQSPLYWEHLRKQQIDEDFQVEEEARIRAEAEARWLKVEEEAQKQWQLLQKKLDEAREERERQNALIKLEWEREQQRLKEIKEQKQRELEEKERQQRLLEEEIDNFVKNGGSTPERLKGYVESNPGKEICPFFHKTATCRFREVCSRNHVKPKVSRILLFTGFYSHYSLEQTETEHGDSSLEFESDETYTHFKEFFLDVLPEMERYGTVRQFKVCCNKVLHLRGNVYVEYSLTREAVKSFQVFNGRWYGGKRLSIEFCNIDSWKSAICGLHFLRRCPKGSSCNFMHVFKNPHNMFHNADRDEHRTPPERFQSFERREWRWSESPERLSLDDLSSRKNNCTRRRRRSRSRSRRRSSRKRSSSRLNHSEKKSRRSPLRYKGKKRSRSRTRDGTMKKLERSHS